MWSAAVVLACALDLLGRSAESFPPIVVLEARPPAVSADADAFTRRGDSTIYLLATSPSFQTARTAIYKCGQYDALRKLASVLVHEEWHIRNGTDEEGAYAEQLRTLASLNAGPGHPIYRGVARSMKVARERPKEDPPSRVFPMVVATR
jgi:hypothetical protein